MIISTWRSNSLSALAAVAATACISFTAVQAADTKASACEFVASYSLELQEISPDLNNSIRIVASVADFALMGECISNGCSTIDGPIIAVGNEISFVSDQTSIRVTNLSVEDFAKLQTPASSYEEWADGHVAAGLSDEDGDSDGDGISNLLEYAFGLDPSAADRSGTEPSSESKMIDGAPFLTLSFSRNLTKTDIAFEVQTSTDLADGGWTNVGVEDEIVSKSGQIATHLAKIRSDGTHRFLRLVVHRR